MPRKSNDWNCPKCGYLCFASKDICYQCRTPNPNISAARPGDWNCVCGGNNFAHRTRCHMCGKDKAPSADPSPNPAPVVQPAISFKPGDWNCSCSSHNFANRTHCRDCGKARAEALAPELDAEDNKCKVCYERDKDSTLPCGHFGLCMVCALASNRCPFCRKEYAEHQIKKTFSI